jgi:uncharacterized protein with NAD-binding domain and iron-sulfur cluster
MRSRTRREFLRDGAALAAAGTLPQSLAYAAGRRKPRRSGRGSVAVLGGGPGGLTAAHELAERGFDVTVYERRAFGGKARSFGVPGTASGGRRPLPGEHGHRIIPGLYPNLPETLRRIPFPGNQDGVFGNVVAATQDAYIRRGREPWILDYAPTDLYPWTLEQFREFLIGWLQLAIHLPPQELAYFAQRILVFCASCDARRLGQWEQMSWSDYVAADRFSEEYRRTLVESATEFLLSSTAREASARTLGLLWEAGTYNNLGRGANGPYDRVFNLPTTEAFIGPWVTHLRRLGVKLHLGAEVEKLELRGGRITTATVRSGSRRQRIEADWFVLAVPVERARPLLRGPIMAADPQLEGLDNLVTRSQNGIKIFLHKPLPIVHGHVLYLDSPWALSSISQAQFWEGRSFSRDYGDGSVRESFSVDIANFDEPGILYGKPARQLHPAQIAREVWEQMKVHLNGTGRSVLRDEQIVSWNLDPGLVYGQRGGARANMDPLMISAVGTWSSRPAAATAIPNLFLAADYVQVSIDTATMEGANEAGKRASNALLAAADSPASPAAVNGLYQPPEWEPFRRADEQAYAHGLPNALDTPPPPSLPLPVAL